MQRTFLTIRQFIANLSWDDVVYFLVGTLAIVFAVSDIIEAARDASSDSSNQPAILAVLGLLLMSVTAQSVKRRAEIDLLRQAIGLVETQSLETRRAFPQQLAFRVSAAKNFVLDTDLNNEILRAHTDHQNEYKRILETRLAKHDLRFLKVVVIYHKRALEKVVHQLLIYENHEVYFRHYPPPPKGIPIIHMMSFDNEHFYLGGFNRAESSDRDSALYIRDPNAANFLQTYWNVLWHNAIPLKTGRVIYWDELLVIAKRLGISKRDFEQMRSDIQQQVAQSE